MPVLGSLCHIRDRGPSGPRLLLQLRAEGLVGAGRWNGPGGHVEPGESPEQSAVREVLEETGLAVRDLRDHGALTYFFGEAIEAAWVVHVFSTERFDGDLRASREGRLEWFAEDALPYDEMFPDDRHWLPHLLAGRRFRGHFRLTDDLSRVISHELEVH